MPSWESIEPGTLVDFEIEELCPSKLIVENFDPASVKQTCYELRVGDMVWYTYFGDPANRRIVTENQGGVYLPSRAYATIITKEKLHLPEDCVGRIMTKGQLFSIGISAVNTYADPGFRGPLGITLMNNSSRPVFIPIGDPIAKIEFVKLNKRVHTPYTGRHLEATELWPIPDYYYSIPSLADSGMYEVGLKDPTTQRIESRIDILEQQMTQKKYYIRALYLILIPLAISTILYWISDWSSMAATLKYALATVSAIAVGLAVATGWWQLVCKWFKSA